MLKKLFEGIGESHEDLRLRGAYYFVKQNTSNSPDIIKLREVISKPNIASLIKEAKDFEDFESDKFEDVLEDLRLVGDQDSKGIYSWIRSNKEWLSETFDKERLDLIWLFHWTFQLHPSWDFERDYVIAFGRLRGKKPSNLGRTFLYNSALVCERKQRINERERSIFMCAKRGDVESLVRLGFKEEQASYIINRVKELSNGHGL